MSCRLDLVFLEVHHVDWGCSSKGVTWLVLYCMHVPHTRTRLNGVCQEVENMCLMSHPEEHKGEQQTDGQETRRR